MSPMSYYQRPFSPSAYSLPGSLNSSIIMPHGRSLGKSFDSHDFHDSFKIASTNHRRKIESTQVIFKRRQKPSTLHYLMPVFSVGQGGEGRGGAGSGESGTVRIQHQKKQTPSYSKAMRLLLCPALMAVGHLGGSVHMVNTTRVRGTLFSHGKLSLGNVPWVYIKEDWLTVNTV